MLVFSISQGFLNLEPLSVRITGKNLRKVRIPRVPVRSFIALITLFYVQSGRRIISIKLQLLNKNVRRHLQAEWLPFTVSISTTSVSGCASKNRTKSTYVRLLRYICFSLELLRVSDFFFLFLYFTRRGRSIFLA